jgi:dTMP kinase
MEEGKLIVFEGPDGVGKSTLVQGTVDFFTSRNLKCEQIAFPGREHGSLGYHIYTLHHDPAQYKILNINPTSLQVLHIAAHIDTIDRYVVPKLREGTHVILDRYWWSSWVYGKVDGAPESSLDAMTELEKAHWGSYIPRAVFLIDRRSSLRTESPWDKFHALRSAYKELAAREVLNYPVHVIANDENFPRSIEQIVRLLNDIITP